MRRRELALGCVLCSLLATPVVAATRVWTGAGPDANWSAPANWAGGIAPVPGDDLEFPTGAARPTSTNDFPAGTFFGNLQFGSGDFAILGNGFILGGDVIVGESNSSGVRTWTTFITVPVTLSEAATPVLHLLDTRRSHRLVFGATLAGGPNAHLLKRGVSIAEFDAANTFAGPTFIEQGTLAVHHAQGLGGVSGPTHVRASSVLSFVLPGTVTIAEPLVLSATRSRFVPTIQHIGGGRLILSGDVDVPSAAILLGTQYEVSGRIQGSGRLDFRASSVTLSGGPNAIGSITVRGRLVATNPDALPEGTSVAASPLELTSLNERLDACDSSVQLAGAVVGFSNGSCSVTGFGQVFVTDGSWSPSVSTVIGGRITLKNAQLRVGSNTAVGADQLVIDPGSTLTGAGTVRNAIVRGHLTSGVALADRAVVAGTIEVPINPVGLTPTPVPLVVTGTLELQDADLRLRVSVIPAVGQEFTIIDNRGTSPIAGTFVNAPEGAVVTKGGADFRVSYRGGSGNDVTLTVVGFRRFFSEGVNSSVFSTRFALFNPHEIQGPIDATFRFLRGDGVELTHTVTVPGATRRTLDTRSLPGLVDASFSTSVESSGQIMVERTTFWSDGRGAHGEAGVPELSRTWYFAEGVTSTSINLFYLVLNPHDQPLTVAFEFQRPSPLAPVLKTYVVAPRTRTTVWVNHADPALTATDVAATVRSTLPTLVERSLYANTSYASFDAGHSAVGAPELSHRWRFMEGAVGDIFDTYLLLSNPGDRAAGVTLIGSADVSSPFGSNAEFARVTVPPRSRVSIDLDTTLLGRVLIGQRTPRPETVGVLLIVDASEPIVAERAMWWRGSANEWRGAHASLGFGRVFPLSASVPAGPFVMVDGEENGPWQARTYLATFADTITVYLEDGRRFQRSVNAAETFGRATVNMLALFPELAGQRYSAVSTGLAERSTYFNTGGEPLAAGVSVKGTPLF